MRADIKRKKLRKSPACGISLIEDLQHSKTWNSWIGTWIMHAHVRASVRNYNDQRYYGDLSGHPAARQSRSNVAQRESKYDDNICRLKIGLVYSAISSIRNEPAINSEYLLHTPLRSFAKVYSHRRLTLYCSIKIRSIHWHGKKINSANNFCNLNKNLWQV